jgi:acetyl-CoA carboxylase carboxyltransferase component
MGPEQLSGVMETITRISAERAGKKIDETKLRARTDALRSRVDRDSVAYKLSSYLYDDAIIDPRDTRDVLGFCLEVVKNRHIETNPGSRHLARI